MTLELPSPTWPAACRSPGWPCTSGTATATAGTQCTPGVEDQNYLRGVQVADANGAVKFASIFPACYSGRWPHIHFEVYPDRRSITDASKAIATSQVALPQDVCEKVYAVAGYEASVANLDEVSRTSDNVFGDDGGAQTGHRDGQCHDGYTVSLAVGVDTTTTPSGGQPVRDGAPPAFRAARRRRARPRPSGPPPSR